MYATRFVEEIPCEDGEILRFYYCFHNNEWILTTFAPPPKVVQARQ